MNILFLRGFNNYHKRTIIKYTTLADYKSNCSSFLDYSAINFNPNDGIVTEYTVGSANQKENSKILMFEDVGAPDYCVCYEIDKDSNVTIKSRWFILESQRIRAGQYRLALKRDVIADHLDFLINSNCFMEKAQISNINSPFIFNNESMTYNQIKKKEIPLYDSTGTAWLVGYIAKSFNGNGSQQSFDVTATISDTQDSTYLDMSDTPWGTLTATQIADGISFRTVDSFNIIPIQSSTYTLGDWRYTSGRNAKNNTATGYNINYNFGSAYGKVSGSVGSFQIKDGPYGPGLGIFSGEYQENIESLIHYTRGANRNSNGYAFVASPHPVTSAQDFSANVISRVNLDSIVNQLKTASAYDTTGVNNILRFRNQQVKVGTKYYSIVISEPRYTINGVSSLWGDLDSATQISLYTAIDEAAKVCTGGYTHTFNNSANGAPIWPVYADFDVQFREIPASLTVKVKCPNQADRWPCNDQLFDMFCIPFGELKVSDNESGSYVTVTTKKDAALAAARALAEKGYSASNLYDLQVLPYCPIKNIRDAYTEAVSIATHVVVGGVPITTYGAPHIVRNGAFVIDATDHGKDGSYQRVYDNLTNEILSYVFWATDSHGTFDVHALSSDTAYYQYATAVESDLLKKKISNETEMFRLCSPNYNGVFEYSAAKNNDKPTGQFKPTIWGDKWFPDLIPFNVDYTYRPSNPYIHLNPAFKGEEEGAIYGQDWNDVRGLICGGDFSMGYIVEKFREYQIQNANFQNIFDRQIQNIDVNNKLAREQMTLSNIMNAVGLPTTGAVTGALAGAKAGPYGAIAGGVAGGALGIGGAVAGVMLNEDWLNRQQQETRNYSIDMYNYQLGNIKALPYSISRTDCLAENTRLVPFLEVYEATEQEIENLLNVIKYSGMTIMVIDKPGNHRTGTEELAVSCHGKSCFYMKGQLIMNPDSEMEDDFHIVDALYSEFNKGIYLEGV